MKKAISALFNAVSDVSTEEIANTPEVEETLRNEYKQFCLTTKNYASLENFDGLLHEKKGYKFRRDDGTINWFHEAVPIMLMLALVKKGKHNGGLDEKDLARYGGLDVGMSTHWRHDSIEDFLKEEQFRRQQLGIRSEIGEGRPDYDMDATKRAPRIIAANVKLMSQQILTDEKGRPILENGKPIKEDVRTYTRRLVDFFVSNPIVFLLKQLDVVHNLATMLGAPKFDAERRKKRCNEREDMYGPRLGFTDRAIHQWPEFKNAFTVIDCMMGFLLYSHFRYLESVDLAYPDKKPTNDPIGIRKYIDKAMSLSVPEGFHPIHIFINRMMNSVDAVGEPEKFERLQNFIENVFKPSLAGHEEKFPYLFKPQPKQNYEISPQPVAM